MKLAVQVFLAEVAGLALLLALLAGGAYWQQSRTQGDYTRIIGLNWGLLLPEAQEELYATDSGPSFHGDGLRYHVLQYGVGENPGQAVAWRRGPEEETAAGAAEILDGLAVPQEHRPKLTGSYLWCTLTGAADWDRLYLIWEPTVQRLYVAETFQ